MKTKSPPTPLTPQTALPRWRGGGRVGAKAATALSRFLVPLLCGLLHVTSAFAQPAPDSDPCLSDPRCAGLNEAARKLSKEGQLDAALVLYQTAYTHRPVAWLLVNIGRVQQKMFRLPDAIKSFRQYLASPDAKQDLELTKRTQEYLQQAEVNPKIAPPEQRVQQADVCLTDASCNELNETARSLSKAGHYGLALAMYETAYEQHPAPWLLVNIGRIQQKLLRLADAIKSYRQYLASPDAKDDLELMKKAQEYLEQAEADFEPPPPPLTPPPPPPPPPPPGPGDDPSEGYGSKEVKQKRNGFAIQLGFGTRRPIVQLDATTTAQSSSFGGSLFLGAKLNRLIIGVGLEIDYFSASTQLTSQAGTATTTAATTSFLVTPGVQLAVLRVAAGRLELLASAQVGLGRAFTNRTQDPSLPSPLAPESQSINFHVNYQLGPGLRVYVMPRLALSLIAGLSGDHFFAAQDSPTGLRDDKLASLSIFGGLSALGVF